MSLLHAIGNDAGTDVLHPEDVFSTYLYTGNGGTQTINNGIDLSTIRNEVSFTLPGTYQWVVPHGVTRVSAVCVGGGGGGFYSGGGGGGLGWKNDIPVTPGSTITIVVGVGGRGTSPEAGKGGDSSFAGTVVIGYGGGGATNGVGAIGGGYVGDGGGKGGNTSVSSNKGGGGAGGYIGDGGSSSSGGYGGAGGGGGVGDYYNEQRAGGGGGVGIFGQGNSGAHQTTARAGGFGGSGGTDGAGTTGGSFGGGGGGYNGNTTSGGGGAVRVIWGVGRAFPSTNTGPQTDSKAGGLIWIKSRSSAYHHGLFDTNRGAGSVLYSSQTSASAYAANTLSAFLGSGFSIGSNSFINNSGVSFASWTFRKAPKFFDVVTYTGDGVAGRQIPHSLGVAPGMIVIKCTNSSNFGGSNDNQLAHWWVYHKDLGSYELFLNKTDAMVNAGGYVADSSSFTVYGSVPNAYNAQNNLSGYTYVAYLFAHDDSEDGIIQCGSFTTNASSGVTEEIYLGYEPQYIMLKNATSTSNWMIFDSMRGLALTQFEQINANTSGNAAPVAGTYIYPTANGFRVENGTLSANHTYIYMAIRRPNKVPTSGTEVYNAIARTGTGAAAMVTGVGFAPDLWFGRGVSGPETANYSHVLHDKLRGATRFISTSTTAKEYSSTADYAVTAFINDGITIGPDNQGYINYSASAIYINHFFKRAKGFFDIVCYTGTGVARTVNHNLGVAPELMIVKCRAGSSSYNWVVSDFANGVDDFLNLNLNGATQYVPSIVWNSTLPTSSVFSLGTAGGVNQSGYTYVWYGFASLPGISKVGSYTGNGSSQTINCGFTAGARFILIKRTDSTGDWYVWDTARGIVAANDPHLSLNSKVAEVTTDDSVDPDSSGFIVNQVAATNINVNAGTYIFLAIA